MADINLGVGGANSAVAGGYDIANSLKLEIDNAEQLYYTPSSAGNLKTWTYSCWFKRTELSYNMMLFGANDTYAYFETDDTLKLRFTGTYVFDTARVFRDTSAWTHIVVAVDTTQATQADRIKIYFNGEDQTGLFANDSFPAQNTNTSWNNTLVHYVAGWATASFNPSCYLAEVYNIDGQKLEATDFGEFDADTGIWKPKAYTGSYGTNGYHLDFENASDLGTVAAGTQHSFVKSNITSADQATDTPTNNFCTLNVLSTLGSVVYTQGATVGTLLGAGDEPGEGTMTFTSGKWYYEASVPTSASTADAMFGFGRANYWGTNSVNPGGDTYAWSYHSAGRIYYNNNNYESYGSGFGKGDIVSIAIDVDNTKFYVAVNGTWQNSADPAAGTGGWDYSNPAYTAPVIEGDSLVPAFRIHYNTYQPSHYNFGGYTVIPISSAASDENDYGTFEYAPPSGYYALCSKNLAEFG